MHDTPMLGNAKNGLQVSKVYWISTRCSKPEKHFNLIMLWHQQDKRENIENMVYMMAYCDRLDCTGLDWTELDWTLT